mmetsp:Transcript_103188/g.292334  ORF Transcript_103188/g.292334 Transcript_103188/m.292334 type:complete len:245 (-) Transcript_103188:1353-2087(-)
MPVREDDATMPDACVGARSAVDGAEVRDPHAARDLPAGPGQGPGGGLPRAAAPGAAPGQGRAGRAADARRPAPALGPAGPVMPGCRPRPHGGPEEVALAENVGVIGGGAPGHPEAAGVQRPGWSRVLRLQGLSACAPAARRRRPGGGGARRRTGLRAQAPAAGRPGRAPGPGRPEQLGRDRRYRHAAEAAAGKERAPRSSAKKGAARRGCRHAAETAAGEEGAPHNSAEKGAARRGTGGWSSDS